MTSAALTTVAGKSQQFTTLRIDKIFSFHRPSLPLAKFVDCFWLYEGSAAEPQSERILPTGTFELAINLRQNELSFHDELSKRCSRFSGAVVSGAHGHGFLPQATESIHIIGVHFKPGGAFPFLGLPAGELADTHIDLDMLWGPAAGRLRERLAEARDSAERFHLLERSLLKRLSLSVENHYAVAAALEMFGKNQVRPKVREAAKYLGLSQRRLIEVFKAEVGLTPKLFSRIQRFQHARSCIQKTPAPNWAALALDLGYFDQSHLIREFLEFSGVGPSDYLNQQRSTLSNTSAV